MLSEEIKGIQATLGEFAGRVSEEDWQLISRIRKNLKALAEQAAELEKNLSLTPEAV